MSFFNRRFGFFLLLDAAILLSIMGIFTVLNHSVMHTTTTVNENSPITLLTSVTPVASLTSQSITPHKTIASILESKPGDEFNLLKLRSKTVKINVHYISMGENYWGIAKKNGIDVATLIGANPTMSYQTIIHQAINILSRKGVLYTVQKGDDISKIAAAFGTEAKTVISENGITWWNGLKEGDVLFIPGVKPLLMDKEWKDNYFGRMGIFGNPLGQSRKINSAFSFRTDPITGEIRHHNGVDLKAKYGDCVYAAASGRVIFTGVSGGYGNLIIIANANQYQTYYGHLSKIIAKHGQKVRRGTLIGKVGATGRVTGPHLHFEIRKNGKPVDPLPYI